MGSGVTNSNELSLLVGDAEVPPTSMGNNSHSSFCLLPFHGNSKSPDSNGLPFGLLFLLCPFACPIHFEKIYNG